MSANPLVGIWQLLAFESKTSTGEVSYPYGKDPKGQLMYGPDGYMAVAVVHAHRPHFQSSDPSAATHQEKSAAFDTYATYCGTYEIQHDKIIHRSELSLFPNWSGKLHERFFQLSGDRLVLRTPPMTAAAVQQALIATWRRVPS